MSAVGKGWVLIDTSVWVSVLRTRSPVGAGSEAVTLALRENRAALCDPVWVELYRGVRGKRDLNRLESLKSLCLWLAFDVDCWRVAAEAARACREQGQPVPLGDILVFACARRHGVELLENDRHFAAIAAAVPGRASEATEP